MEITTLVPPSSSLYGLGEFTSSTGLRLTRDGLPRAQWTRDQTAATPDINSYGAWPFVMEVRPGVQALPQVLHVRADACGCSCTKTCDRPRQRPISVPAALSSSS